MEQLSASVGGLVVEFEVEVDVGVGQLEAAAAHDGGRGLERGSQVGALAQDASTRLAERGNHAGEISPRGQQVTEGANDAAGVEEGP